MPQLVLRILLYRLDGIFLTSPIRNFDLKAFIKPGHLRKIAESRGVGVCALFSEDNLC